MISSIVVHHVFTMCFGGGLLFAVFELWDCVFFFFGKARGSAILR